MAAFIGHAVGSLLTAMIAFSMRSVNSFDAAASSIVLTPATRLAASPSRSEPPGRSPVAPTAFRQTTIALNGRLSPTIIAFEMAGHAFLSASSTGTGAMFSPPAPISSSLYRPVTRTMPCTSMQPSPR